MHGAGRHCHSTAPERRPTLKTSEIFQIQSTVSGHSCRKRPAASDWPPNRRQPCPYRSDGRIWQKKIMTHKADRRSTAPAAAAAGAAAAAEEKKTHEADRRAAAPAATAATAATAAVAEEKRSGRYHSTKTQKEVQEGGRGPPLPSSIATWLFAPTGWFVYISDKSKRHLGQ